MSWSCCFTYRSVPESEDRMLDEIGDLLSQWQVPENLRHRIMLVISEGYTNAYLHGNCKNADKLVKICLVLNETDLIVDIYDEGNEQESLNKIKNRKPADLLGENGRGVDLMMRYADDIRFERGEKGGLKVTVCFNRDNKKEIRI